MDLMIIAAMAAVAVALIVYSIMPKGKNEKDAVRRRLTGGRSVDEVAEIRNAAREQATATLVKKATPMLNRLIMPASEQEQTALRVKLANAGIRAPYAQTVFLASKTILGFTCLLLGAMVGFAKGLPFAAFLGALAFGGGVGFMLPNLWLALACSDRKDKIRNGLPDTLDLMVVSVESGLALDAALKRVGDEMAPVHPALSEEMRIATIEAQMGIPRGEALENMARRSGVEEVRSLVSVIMQAEKFGTSVAKALRNQADSLRTKRRQAAEERAQKTAVKLMIPLVLFIFPAMGVVLGGPAVIKMIEALKSSPSLG